MPCVGRCPGCVRPTRTGRRPSCSSTWPRWPPTSAPWTPPRGRGSAALSAPPPSAASSIGHSPPSPAPGQGRAGGVDAAALTARGAVEGCAHWATAFSWPGRSEVLARRRRRRPGRQRPMPHARPPSSSTAAARAGAVTVCFACSTRKATVAPELKMRTTGRVLAVRRRWHPATRLGPDHPPARVAWPATRRPTGGADQIGGSRGRTCGLPPRHRGAGHG